MLGSQAVGVLGRPSSRILTRSVFTARAQDPSKPKWFRVSLALGSTVALLGLLIKQHSEDVAEYKKRNGLE